MTFPIDRIRADVPMLGRTMHDRPLVYLDTAATALKPQQVVDRLVRFYTHEYGTVRRGAYLLSNESTAMYEGVRAQAAAFFGAADPSEVVFVRGVTEAINLFANAWGRANLTPGDRIVVSQMEHHANIVPWQLVCAATGAELVPAPIDDRGCIELDALHALLDERTKVVSIVHVSNGLGTVNPVADIARMAHEVGALMVVDGAQSAPHLPVDVQALGCDVFACSGHKMYGPTGVGVLWAHRSLLDAMPPWQGGGEMIEEVSFDGTTWEEPPHRFEAGTPPFAQVVGLGAALAWLSDIGMDAVAARDAQLVAYAGERLAAVPGLRLLGDPPHRSGLMPFVMDGIHPLDIGTVLDREGICIRVGKHCVHPLMDRLGISASARASFGVYTTESEIDALVAGLHVVHDLLA